MDQPYWTPLSFHPTPSPPPRSSSLAPTLPHQHAVPAQRVQQLQQNVARQSHANCHPTVLQNGIPSVEVRKAVTILQELPNPTIFTYLEGFRSFFRGEQGFDPSQVPPQQCRAVSALVGYPDGLILTWLNNARSPGTLNTSQNLYGTSNLSYGTVVPDFSAQSPSYFSNPSFHTTPRSPWYHESHDLTRDASVGVQSSSAATSNDHNRWCYICEDHEPFTTLNGLKRHMREHYTIYYCIPSESIRYTDGGPICAFCGASNPDPRHLNTHNLHKCVNKKYTRKENLIWHLEDKHGMRNGSVLARQSKYTVDQKYFACGFCVFCCSSLNELVNHIDARHYKYSVQICDWEDDNVIRGLLSQPVVDEYWQSVLAANPHQQSWFTWDHTDAKQLRHRLEMSREPAHILFQAAIDKSKYGLSQHGHGESVPVTGSMEQGMDTSHLTQTLQRGNGLSPLPSTIEQGLASYAFRMTAPTLQSQHLAQDWDGLDHSDRDTNYEGRPSPQIASETHRSPASTMYHPADHPTRPYVLQNTGESFMQHQRPPYVFSNTLASHASKVVEGQAGMLHYSMLGGHSPNASRDVANDPGSRQVVETLPHPTQAHTGWSHPTLPTQCTSSTLSPHRQTSPLGHLNRAYSPHPPALGVHLSSQETRDSHGMDTDSDFDDQQRFMQVQNRSRRQRRNR